MKQFFFVLPLLLLEVLPSFAQNTKISGTVKDAGGLGLPMVTVSVLKATDSTLSKADVTDIDGHFEIELSAGGSYLLHYTLTGYEMKYAGPHAVTEHTTKNTAAITLAKLTRELTDVTVSSKKPMIEVKADKMVFNVENSINATGSNALELLRKSPGVVVDNNENISMKGKNGVKVYIDGRMTQLDAKDLAAYLKNINSNDIEAIEMISNPSAKYDASGNAGVVNIKLKKNKKIGTNGSANINFIQGITPKTNGSLNLNYRNKKVNIFGNVSGSSGIYQDYMNLDRTQYDTTYIQKNTTPNDERGINLKAGIDYFLSKQQTVGFLVTSSIGDNVWKSTSNVAIYDKNNNYVKRLSAFNSIPGSRTNNNLNFNYKYADTSGRELNIDGDYGLYRGRRSSSQPNYYYDANNNPLYSIYNKNNTPTNIDIYTLKADWEQKLGKGKLGWGGKVAYVKTDNTFEFFNVMQDLPVKVLGRSNSFGYIENVNAAYANYSNSLTSKISIQAGLRMENTASKGSLTRADATHKADDTVTRNYTDLFPSAAVTWNINTKHSLNLTYSRRIDRPSYQDLNPFENKLDELSYEKGNAYLRPQYTNNVELTHTFMGFVNTTVGYSHVHDFAAMVTDTVGNASFIQQRNLATQKIISLNLGAPLPLAKCCTGYVNLWYTYQMFEGAIGANKLNLNIPSFGAYLMQGFDLGKNYNVEISGWFGGPNVWGGTWKTKSMGSMDIGVQKQFLNKKASLKITLTDVLKTNHWRSENVFGGMVIKGTGGNESQTIRFSFSYRFGSNQISSVRERHTGMESENNRIKR